MKGEGGVWGEGGGRTGPVPTLPGQTGTTPVALPGAVGDFSSASGAGDLRTAAIQRPLARSISDNRSLAGP